MMSTTCICYWQRLGVESTKVNGKPVSTDATLLRSWESFCST